MLPPFHSFFRTPSVHYPCELPHYPIPFRLVLDLPLISAVLFRHWEQLDTLKDLIGRLELFITHSKHCHRICKDENDTIEVAEVEGLYTDHEEADTRLLLHAKHASINYSDIVVRSPDTDVFILMLGHTSSIDANLYLDTGAGNYRRVIDINKIQESVGANVSSALIGFHAFTGICIFLLDTELIKRLEFPKRVENCLSCIQSFDCT